MRPTAAQMAASLGLEPHPEGGYYAQTYRAAQTLSTPRGERPASTAIMFLVTAESISKLHRLTSDELWVFQGGLPLEQVTISPDGDLQQRVLGVPEDTAPGRVAQALVPAGSWQGARLAGGPHLPASRAWALTSCVVTPGFVFEDFEMGDRERLLAQYPQHAGLIGELT